MGLRKLLSVLALAVGLVGAGALGLAPKASADDGPHGGYLPDTGACAGCHRAHTAVGPLLLTEETLTGLCLSCHDGSTATATNVRDGLSTGGARLAGGGFEYAWRGTPQGTSPANWTRTNVGVATHGVDAEGTAWGGASAGAGVTGELGCTSCHNPHGSTNFRILRDASNGFPTSDSSCGGIPGCAAKAHRWLQSDEVLNWVSNQVVAVPESAEHDYSPDDAAYYSGVVRMGSTSSSPPATTVGMNAFCATCHKQYLTKRGAFDYPSTDPNYYVYPGTQDAQDGKGDVARYRHAVLHSSGSPESPLRRGAVGTIAAGEGGGNPTTCGDGLDNDADTAIDLADSECAISYGATPTYTATTCLTCHFAHGSAAANSIFGGPAAPTNDNALLYYDNRGVCRSCHQKDK